MKKKKEFPRKRKRFVKKIVFLILILIIVIAVAGSVSFYYFEAKMQKLYPIVSKTAHPIQSNQQDKTYTELQNGLNKDQIAYTSINSGSDSYVVMLEDGGKVTFSSQKDIMIQIASLQYILSHLTMEGRQFSTLDLRFDQPVIVLKP